MFEIQPKKQIIRVIQTQDYKGYSDPSHFIFEINVGKSRIRQDKTNFKLNDEFLDRVGSEDFRIPLTHRFNRLIFKQNPESPNGFSYNTRWWRVRFDIQPREFPEFQTELLLVDLTVGPENIENPG